MSPAPPRMYRYGRCKFSECDEPMHRVTVDGEELLRCEQGHTFPYPADWTDGERLAVPGKPLPGITNWFAAGRRGDGRISLGLPLNTASMSADEAMVLAAWLVTLAGDDERFARILQAVRST